MKVALNTVLSVLASVTLPLHCEAAPSKKTAPPAPQQSEIVIDAIAASVDDKPITLTDLSVRLRPPRKLSLAQASKDPEAMKVLDQLILEKVLEEEAKVKRVVVGDSELDDYMNEVAQRNNMTREQFVVALSKEGQDLQSYKQQIKLDILKAKLASTITRGGVSTSETEVDEYLESHPDLKVEENTIKLHQIIIRKEGRSTDEVTQKAEAVARALDSGTPFSDVAAKHADNGAVPDGTLVGVLAESDLSGDISSAVDGLKTGEHSKPVETESGVQIFFVERRYTDDDDDNEEALRAEARQIIQKQKTQQRLASYFGEELFKNHAVDKRL
jgi:peptidyl-prolyl cis-trans isomerase SurA